MSKARRCRRNGRSPGRTLGGFLLLFLATLLFGWAPSAEAQPKDGDRYEQWGVRCRTVQGAGELCTIEHAAYNSNTQQRVTGIRIGYPPDGDTPRAVVVVPLRVVLQAGLRIQVDQGEAKTFQFEICAPDGCQVNFEITPEMLAELKAGQGGEIQFLRASGRKAAVPFSLQGFSAALAALK